MSKSPEAPPSSRRTTVKTTHDPVTFAMDAALSMEHAVLELLSALEHEVERCELKTLFSHHADETFVQIESLEHALAALGSPSTNRPCRPIEAIETQSKLNVEFVNDRFADAMILTGAAEAAHHEIAIYESLITVVQSLGDHDAQRLLREHLRQEHQALENVKHAIQRIVRQAPCSLV